MASYPQLQKIGTITNPSQMKKTQIIDKMMMEAVQYKYYKLHYISWWSYYSWSSQNNDKGILILEAEAEELESVSTNNDTHDEIMGQAEHIVPDSLVA